MVYHHTEQVLLHKSRRRQRTYDYFSIHLITTSRRYHIEHLGSLSAYHLILIIVR